MITYNEIYNDLTYHKDGMIYRVEKGSNTVYVLKNEGFEIPHSKIILDRPIEGREDFKQILTKRGLYQ